MGKEAGSICQRGQKGALGLAGQGEGILPVRANHSRLVPIDEIHGH